MNLIWSDFNINSENLQKMIRAKQINGPDYWPTMREVFAYDCAHLPLNRFRLWASIHNKEYFDKIFANKNVNTIPLVSPGLEVWDGGNIYYVVKQ